jgi:hypothetical protein
MNRISRNCETCGGPLPANAKSKTITCQYCGSIYENANYDPSIIEDEPTILNEIPSSPIDVYNSNVPPVQSRTAPRVIISIIAVVLICTISLLFFNMAKKTPGGKLNSLVTSRPTMLESLPNGEYTGTAVPYQNWEIIVSPELKIAENEIGISLKLTNWNESSQIFVFKPNDLVLYDDIGNTYPIRTGNCPEDSGYQNKQISFDAFEQKQFASNEYWCSDSIDLPIFFGTIQGTQNIYTFR